MIKVIRSYFNHNKWVLVPLFLFISFLFFGKPAGNGLTKTQIEQAQSINEIREIARLILDYKAEHGEKLPSRLSEVVPKYHFKPVLQMFYNPVNSSQKPSDRYANKDILDEEGDYVLSAIPGILVYEKPGLWPDGSVTVCYQDLTIKRLKAAEFEALAK